MSYMKNEQWIENGMTLADDGECKNKNTPIDRNQLRF